MHFLSSRFLISSISSAVIGELISKFLIPIPSISLIILAAPILFDFTITLLIFISSKFFFIELHGFQSSPKALNDKKRKEIIKIFYIETTLPQYRYGIKGENNEGKGEVLLKSTWKKSDANKWAYKIEAQIETGQYFYQLYLSLQSRTLIKFPS